MFPRRAALLTVLALAAGVSACGADDELSSDIPRTSPDLTIPTATTELAPDATTTTSTTTTATTTTTPAAGTQPPVVAPPPVVPPPVAPPSSTTGGAAPATGTGQATTGGAQPGDGEFESFCRDNPGAGPPC